MTVYCTTDMDVQLKKLVMIKHMFHWCIGLVAVLHYVYGTAITTLNCSEPGFLGQSYSFTCHTTGTISSGIFWNGPVDRSVAGCKPSGECAPDPGYKTSVNGNQYMLHIERLGEDDAGTWKCTDGASESKTGACSLDLSLHPSEMNCNITKLNVSTLTFDLESYYCSRSARFRLLISNRLSCDVEHSSYIGSESQIVNGTCNITKEWVGMVYPVMSCHRSHEFNLTCRLELDSGSVSGTELLAANKACLGWFLTAVCLILYVR